MDIISEEEGTMQNYAKLGGILSIVAGGLGCLSSLFFVLFAILMGVFAGGDMFSNHYYSGP